jgi:type IV pilus assembly protein PilP
MMRTLDHGKSAAAVLVTVLATLTGCGAGQEHSDLRSWIEQVQTKPAGKVEPLPSFEQVPPFAYQASDMRSPFDPPVVLKPIDRTASGVQVVPDPNRVKQYLEQFPIASLAMVGTLSQGARLYGLVRDDQGAVHRVQNGDYMGTDHGRVQKIGDNELELIEIVSDGTGGWVERGRTVSLGETNRG